MTMTNLYTKTRAKGALLALLLILGLSGTSQGAEYWLRAETVNKTMPDGAVITMWGFAECDSTFTACSPATVPGPQLTVPVGDGSGLTVHLMNSLATEPVSLIIPGLQSALAPVKGDPAGTGKQRVTSFVAAALPGATNDYVWPTIKPGTYLYQSGTHPALQVPMGLYGAVTHDAAAGQAYGASTAYAQSATLLFSEIDPSLHTAVATGAYGTPAYPSTIHFKPRYFLINGTAHSAAAPIILPAGTADSTTLLRLLNAGIKMRTPTLTGLYLSLVAEDGNLYPFAREQYAAMLAPGKTMDALIKPATYGTYAVFDRALGLANNLQANGGMLAYLSVGTGGADKIGVFRSPNRWFLDKNGNGVWDPALGDVSYWFGIAGDVPGPGDWNGDGVTDIAIFRSGRWLRDMNGDGVWTAGVDLNTVFGIAGDKPVTGDWNGDGVTEVGVFRNGTWLLDFNSNGIWNNVTVDRRFIFGTAADTPVAGDWNGDGVTDIGTFNAGTWQLDLNGNGMFDGCGTDLCYTFGQAGDVPSVGDWDGNGTSNLGVRRGNRVYVDSNANGVLDIGVDVSYLFGITGDIPVVGKW